MVLNSFHPAVSSWFQKTFAHTTQVQEGAWAEIQKDHSVLIAAPTGSGKTLASFLGAIDALVRQGCAGSLEDQTSVVYVSPLKALSNDIERNLQLPLKGIAEELKHGGFPEVNVKVAVRTGDTPVAQRTSMTKNPPHILVTTPESLYLLLTSAGGRKMLSTVRTLIVDEIHSIVNSKRGSHLSLSMERLETLAGRRLQRIGISATQKPIEKVASFLMGTGEGRHCAIINTGHRRQMDLSMEVPGSPLTSVMAHEVWGEIYERLENLIGQHKTTLIFVNTRRLAERLALHLTERLGPEAVTAHHGSMSKERRFDAEQRLKAGALKALVATASLELGIDIGYVDLVCQIGSPRSIAAFLQRVGRSGHSVDGTPKGKLFPLTRDELLECTAIFDAVRRGELDEIIMPEKPIDVLAQQMIAEVASDEKDEDALYSMVTAAYPYRDLDRNAFDEAVQMISEGFTTRRGKRGAYIFHDVVHRKLRARKGARLTAITNGGAIPDNFDFDVIKEPENIFVGTLNEDFAIESLPGDIFQLGNASYRITRVENGKVKVEDAHGLPPSLPFWLGEAPGRSPELSFAVSRLREEISERLGTVDEYLLKDEEAETHWKKHALDWLVHEVGICAEAADQLVIYLALAKTALGVIPTQERLVLERFFDEAGDMHIVLHSPYGNRLNRGWGLALRKRFCKKFNFELQAAATEDAIILSLGSTHSFPVEEVFGYLKAHNIREILIQALLDSPMFEIRWRWNASTALAVLRRRGGQKVAPQLQRMQSEDLVALVFPDQLACFENIQGEREVPEHPLVDQAIHDCLTEAMDIALLEKLLKKIEQQEIVCIAKDLREPSPLAQEILSARPYAFLDDAPLEERRTRAVLSRRWLDPSEASDLGRLDQQAIELVKSEAWPVASSPDELQDAMSLLGYVTSNELLQGDGRFSWLPFFEELSATGRAAKIETPGKNALYISVDRLPFFEKIFDPLPVTPVLSVPDKLRERSRTKEEALQELVRGRLEGLGPVTEERLSEELSLPQGEIQYALLALEQEGFVFRGSFIPGEDKLQWCERRLLARIHRYTLQKLRREIEAVSPADFMRYLIQWQGIDAEAQAEGPQSVENVLMKLEGFEASAAAWEGDVLPLRLSNYDPAWLDFCCMNGKFVWGRFGKTETQNRKAVSPIKTTPVMLVSRRNADVWKAQSSGNLPAELSPKASAIIGFLAQKGASFFEDIVRNTGLLESQAEESIAELVSAGCVTSDSFNGLRALLVPSKYKLQSARRAIPFTMDDAGRWSIIGAEAPVDSLQNRFLEMTAKILLKRYGVVFRKIAEQEAVMPPWRELVRIYRSMEARGEIRGGRFVDGVWGEQFALPEAVVMLREVRKKEPSGLLVSISAADPLNLVGSILPGKKVSSYYGNRILLKDGIAVCTLEAGEVHFLKEFEKAEKWELQNKLIQRNISPKIRPYLGKTIL